MVGCFSLIPGIGGPYGFIRSVIETEISVFLAFKVIALGALVPGI
jgi:hypothetical protein